MTWAFLKTGQTLDQARGSLQHLLVELENILGRLGPPSARPGADAFVRWTEVADARLRLLFEESQVATLYDERFWRIREIDDNSVRPAPLIQATVSARKDHILHLQAQLDEMAHVCAPAAGGLVMLDTNIYDHYQPITELPWLSLLDESAVRILVPLVIIDELDRQKDGGGQLSERAGKALRLLRTLPSTNEVIDVRPNVTASVISEPSGHVRRANNDDEIVRQSAYFSAIAPGRVTLVSADYGMQIRAAAANIRFTTMPDKYKLPRKGLEV